jgi:hypothetical protein
VIPIARLLNVDKFKRELIGKHSGEIEFLEHRFRSYKSAHNRVASRVEIIDWLLQFEYNSIPIALKTLNAISFWDRAALSDGLRYGIRALFGPIRTKMIQVFGIGGATTSAHHLSYLWDDIRRDVKIQIRVLNSMAELVGCTT